MSNTVEKFKSTTGQVRKAAREKAVAYLIAAFGLVAGLAWNDAIKSLIERLFPVSKDTVLVKFVYAVLVTFIVVIATIYISKLAAKEKKE